MSRLAATACLLVVLFVGCADQTRPSTISPLPAAAQPSGRVAAKPFLNMPQTAAGDIPRLLSQTGAFDSVRTLTPARGLLPYELVVAFWSDGAEKSRLVAIPEGKVAFAADGEWTFPRGTVFVKTFELATDTVHPLARRRLETRLLVLDRDGGVYGATYKWRADLSDADLVGPKGLDETIAIRGPSGSHNQVWSYPSRENCVTCHNARTAGQLGPKTRQMNCDLRYPGGVAENQLRHWNRLGLFSPR